MGIYHVIKGETIEELEETVEGYLLNGWLLAGGVCAGDGPKFMGQQMRNTFYQAVYLPKDLSSC